MTPFRPLGYPVKVARWRRRVPAGAAPLVPGRVRVGRVLVIPLLGRARLHGDVDVTRVRARWNGRVVQRVNGSMGGAGLAAEVALQPLGRLEFPRLVLLLKIQRFPRQHVLTGREVLSWEAWREGGIGDHFVCLLGRGKGKERRRKEEDYWNACGNEWFAWPWVTAVSNLLFVLPRSSQRRSAFHGRSSRHPRCNRPRPRPSFLRTSASSPSFSPTRRHRSRRSAPHPHPAPRRR